MQFSNVILPLRPIAIQNFLKLGGLGLPAEGVVAPQPYPGTTLLPNTDSCCSVPGSVGLTSWFLFSSDSHMIKEGRLHKMHFI